jgi:hypothetical protein
MVSGRMRMTGDEDDDWFTSYFLPYRDVISRVPVFPCLGNHDSENTEEDEDLSQLIDNLYLKERFGDFAGKWGSENNALDTLFYRFRFGRDAEFIAVDTSFTDKQDGFEFIFRARRGKRQPPLVSGGHNAFIEALLGEPAPPRWRIPFGHHPPFSLGPAHHDNPMILGLARGFAPASPRLGVWFSGHEHNFQHHREGQMHFILTGAAGKCNKVKNLENLPPHTCCHNSVCHFLLVTVTKDHMRIRLIDQEGQPGALTSGSAFTRHENEEIVIPA